MWIFGNNKDKESVESSQQVSEFLSAENLSKSKSIELKLKKIVDSDLIGDYRSSFPGTGLVFSDLKEYQPGDEVKHIHWKATARTGKVFVKTYQEDRRINLIFIIDSSASTVKFLEIEKPTSELAAPGASQNNSSNTKFNQALELTSLLAYLGKSCGDSLGLCLFGEEVEEYLPCKASNNQFYHILRALLKIRPRPKSTNLAKALEYTRKHQTKPALIFVISDFFADDFQKELQTLAFVHDVICVNFENPSDRKLPKVGLAEFIDSESGERFFLDTNSSGKELEQVQKNHIKALEKICRRSGADFINIDADPVSQLRKHMKLRGKRRK